MEVDPGAVRLIVNADDFGRSASINAAVARAHRDGVLTTASLMVNGPAVDEAVALARQQARLGVGLHLTLVCGRSALPAKEIPGLVSATGEFSQNPVEAGLRYFFRRSLREQLEREIDAQIAKFRATGLVMDHLNGHLNLHLHPTIFRILIRNAARWGVRAMRWTHDPLGPNLRLARGRWGYRLSHALVFGLLSRWARPAFRRGGIRHTGRVFGLLQTGQLDEAYLAGLLPRLPAGDSELYSHPCVENFKDEFEALISGKVVRLAKELGIRLIRYQDL